MIETTWGMRFNEHPDYQRVPKGQKPAGCPEWLESHQIHTWQEKGLIGSEREGDSPYGQLKKLEKAGKKDQGDGD